MCVCVCDITDRDKGEEEGGRDERRDQLLFYNPEITPKERERERGRSLSSSPFALSWMERERPGAVRKKLAIATYIHSFLVPSFSWWWVYTV